MKQPTSPARTQRFNEAARTFTPPSPSRHAKLAPFKDGIVELRQKGASLRLIRELLATGRSGCRNGHDRAFPRRGERRSDATASGETNWPSARGRVRADSHFDRSLPGRFGSAAAAKSTRSNSSKPPQSDTPAERSRIRGPRIADPRNL